MKTVRIISLIIFGAIFVRTAWKVVEVMKHPEEFEGGLDED